MTIEFHSPGTAVKQWVINYIKEKMMEFHHRDKNISRAEIYFKEEWGSVNGDKVCGIYLTIYGKSIFIKRHSESYELAARIAIEGLTEKIEEEIKQQNTPPEKITTTIDV